MAKQLIALDGKSNYSPFFKSLDSVLFSFRESNFAKLGFRFGFSLFEILEVFSCYNFVNNEIKFSLLFDFFSGKFFGNFSIS